MSDNSLPALGGKSFEELRRINQHGVEYWSARDLQPLLGYGQWRRFEDAVKRAMTSCEASGNSAEHHFADAGKLITGGKGAVQVVDDYQLYGDVLVRRLAGDLTAQFGRGFGVVNLSQMRKFYTLRPMPQIFQTPSEKSAVPRSGRKLQTLSEKSSAVGRIAKELDDTRRALEARKTKADKTTMEKRKA